MSIFQRFHDGGVFMYVILLFAVVTVALICERATFLFKHLKAPPKGLRFHLLSLISRGDFQAGEDYSKSVAGETSLGRIAALGCQLRANACAEDELQARMDEKLSTEISMIDRRTGFLAMFGNVATLLGLLGTISGMIQAFAAVAQSSPVDRATMLSRGISEAMNCTAFGLLVAIPALVAYAIFQNKTDRVITELTESVSEIYHDLLFLTSNQRSATQMRSQAETNTNDTKSEERPNLSS